MVGDMAKMIAKKKKRVLVENEDEVVPESPVLVNDTIFLSPKRYSLINSNVEVTGDLDGSVKTFHVDTTINQVIEEVQTPGIPVNISNMDTNVIMGEGVMNNESQGNPTIVISSTFDIPTISTNLSADTGGHHSISGIEVDVMLKVQELRLRDELEIIDRNNDKRVKDQSSSFDQELRVVEKEKHLLYVQSIKKVQEDVNLKL
ncbi:unnamed protein product [Lactuca saligna]|uniref:Uncharacterized protein n=1 Tax=Lactuca saligna TaxID=75948 RepID=A0AA35VLJ5_LACSI|nr:unnamed protein product [Lactuca saligna]